MTINSLNKKFQIEFNKQISLKPGEWAVSDREVVISTLLGSCIAVCLYDPLRKIVGMNHFLVAYPRVSEANSVEMQRMGHFGITSMEMMIKKMIGLGAQKERIQAKVFGGASVLGNASSQMDAKSIGDENIEFIFNYLETEGIQITSQSVGGQKGRTVYFESKDYAVYMKTIKSPFNLNPQTQQKAG